MIKEIIKAYFQSDAWARLTKGTQSQYLYSLDRLETLGKGLTAKQFNMPEPVAYAKSRSPFAVARSRSHVDYWGKVIGTSEYTNHEKNKLVAMVKMLYRFAGLGNLVVSLKGFKHERGEASPLTLEDVAKLNRKDLPEDLKLWAVRVVFGYWTGMRPKEVRELLWENVGAEYILVVGAKGREVGAVSRMVNILPEIKACLDYCREYSLGKHVFSYHNRPLNKDIECREVKRLFSVVGIKAELYDARRGLATTMHEHGYKLVDIANQLGHRNITTTQRYIRPSMVAKASAFKGFNKEAV